MMPHAKSVKKMLLTDGYDSRRFISDKEAAHLVKLINAAFGFKISGMVGIQRSKDMMRFRPVEVACKEAREKMGLTVKQVADQMKVQQYRLTAVEENRAEIRVDILERYIDLLGLRDWFSGWVASNQDVYQRIEKGRTKKVKRAQYGVPPQ